MDAPVIAAPVMQVVDVEQGSPEWLLWRKSGVTATCTPILVNAAGCTKTPYQLYLQYVGLLAPEDLSAIKQVDVGNKCEQLARDWAEKRYGQIGLPLCVSHRDYPFMIASLDGIFDNNYLLEIKNLSEAKHLSILEKGIKSEEFQYYYWQVQHQLFVTGSPGAYLLFWSAKDEPKIFFIQASDRAHAQLLKVCSAFWESVVSKTAPTFDKRKDILLISDAEILKQTPDITPPPDLESRVLDLRRQVADLRKIESEMETLRSRLDNHEDLVKASVQGLAFSLGFKPSDPVRIDGFGIRHIETICKGKTSWKAIAEKLDPKVDPDNFPDCVSAESRRIKLTTYEYSPSSLDSVLFTATTNTSVVSEGSHLPVSDDESSVLIF